MAAISTPDRQERALAQPARAGSDSRAARLCLLAPGALVLLWPALYNGFPLIFSDTGTYISQVLEGHLGWDRPPFYSLFLYMTGWGRSAWPPVILQALCTVLLISRARTCLWPRALWSRPLWPRALWSRAGLLADLGIITALGAATSLPWTTSELMPDLFTPLLVLGLFLLIFDPQLRGGARLGLTMLLAAIMTVHLTNLPLYAGLCLVILPASLWRGGPRPAWRPIIAAPVLAVLALVAVNLIGSGRASLSPFGATFYLARLLANGPARLTLGTDCPHFKWALCAYQGSIGNSANAFLWVPDSPLYRAGGPRLLIGQTRQIIHQTIAEHPRAVVRDAMADTARQLVTFRSGDGLRPWRLTAGATIRRDFPARAVAAFERSRQARGKPLLPGWMQRLTLIVETLGLAGTVLVTGAGLLRQRTRLSPLPWLAAMTLLALLGNAILTGSLSGPHDRYQSRIMWLPVLTLLLAAPSMLRPYTSGVDD